MTPKEIFEAGFEAGRREEYINQNPDVGFRFEKTCDQYWEEYNKSMTTATSIGRIIEFRNKKYQYGVKGSDVVQNDWLFSYDSGENYGFAGEIGAVRSEWVGKPANKCCIYTNFFLKPI